MKVLITGSCGFIGVNTALAFLDKGCRVVGVDDLSRIGADENLRILTNKSKQFTFVQADIKNSAAVDDVFSRHRNVDAVLHFAAQVAVTTSVTDPRTDFHTNAAGTFNVLEATRAYSPEAAFIFSSTNKVYGKLDTISVKELSTRYTFDGLSQGVSEDTGLDFHSPYGCSKGAADQYVRDYARIYGLKTVVFRQSCIYGPHQFGMEDQGWVAWFLIAHRLGKNITVYGDGKQVRDLLWIDDLVDLYFRAIERIDVCRGRIYNAGGGPDNTLSLLELIGQMEEISGSKIPFATAPWRPGDQKVFIADVSLAASELGWQPKVTPREGVKRLSGWVTENDQLLSSVVSRQSAVAAT
jgi:CDP-paratose 2-epimerase